MRRPVCVCLFGMLLLGNSLSAASGPTYAFTAVVIPGFTPGSGGGVLGINNVGQVVGQLNDATGSHGVLLSGGNVTILDVPGSSATSARGINDTGQIVGSYGLSYLQKEIGFLFSGGSYTTIAPPGSTLSVARGINNTGQIVGEFSDGQTRHGFLFSQGRFVTIDAPNSTDTQVFGINDAGQIVGAFSTVPNTAPQHGFLLSGGVFTPLDDPEAFDFTYPYGINNAGDIVGFFGDVNHADHAFLFSAGAFTTIDPPGSIFAEALGMNDSGQILGLWASENGGGNFLASPAALVNDLVTLDSVETQFFSSPVETPFGSYPAGTFEIVGRFRNGSAQDICNPFFEVVELSGKNGLLGAFVLADDGEEIQVLNLPSRPSQVLGSGATIPFHFIIGLQTLQPFNFLVNMSGASPATGGRCQ